MANQTKSSGGRPRKEIDFEQLKELVSIFCTKEECAKVLGVSQRTLDARVLEETGEGFCAFYEKHLSDAKSSLRRAQWKAAQKGNATLLIWLGKQYLGQKEDQSLTVHNVEPVTGVAITRAANPVHVN